MAKIQLLLCFTLIIASVSLLEVVSAHATPKGKPSLGEIEVPKTVKEVEPYTVKVVTVFVSDLEKQCPKTPKFKAFFERLRAYARFVCPLKSSDKAYERDMKAKAGSLFQAISSFAVGKIKDKIKEEKMEAIENFKMMKTIAGKIIGSGKENEDSKTLTAEQQKEIKEGILKWETLITRITVTMKETTTTTTTSSSSSSEVSTSAKGSSSSKSSGGKSSGGKSFTFKDTTGSSSNMGSPSGSPKNKLSSSKDASESGKGISSKDTTGGSKISPSASPKGGKESTTGKSSTSSAGSPKSSPSKETSSKDTKKP